MTEGRSGKMKRRSERVERGPRERAGLKRCRTLTNLNATCFKLCQSKQETATLETSCMIALKPKRQAGAGDPLSSDGPLSCAYSEPGESAGTHIRDLDSDQYLDDVVGIANEDLINRERSGFLERYLEIADFYLLAH